MSMMPGVTYQEIQDAILSGYDTQSLEEMLVTVMNERLDVITPPGTFKYRTFRLIQWADMNGRAVELVRAIAKDRPGNDNIQAIYKKYGMAIPTLVQNAGASVAGSPMDSIGGGLEKVVRPYLSFKEFGIWRERMTQVEGRVCMIAIRENAQGTGFLVGPDAVLTNYHVMEPLINGTYNAEDFHCVFDFKKLSNGGKTSTSVNLHATEWKIDASPYSQAESESKPDDATPTTDELDYALIRLNEPVGAKPWANNPNPNGGAPNRGWEQIPKGEISLKSPMGVLIAQHPSGWPLKLAVDTDAIDKASNHWLNSNNTRIRYSTNTLGGSSGSPVYDLEWNLIALHHYGDPDWKNVPAKYNQGIPIQAIRARLVATGHLDAIGGDGV